VRRAFRRAHETFRDYAGPLLVGLGVALIWANLFPASYKLWMQTPWLDLPGVGTVSWEWLVNDVFMTFFFGVVTAHVVSTFARLGSMRDVVAYAFNPFLAMTLGVVFPASLYLAAVFFLGHPEWARGFGIVTATDIAVAWLGARIALGARHPAISFLLLVAIGDDIVSMLVIAFFYPSPDRSFTPEALLWVLGAIVVAQFFSRAFPGQWVFTTLVAGSLSWYGLFHAGLHPALALVPIVPFLPFSSIPTIGSGDPSSNASPSTSKEKVESRGDVSKTPEEEDSPLERFAKFLSGPVDDGLFLFALANGGVEFSHVGILSWVIALSLLFGKTVGIYTVGRLTVAVGWLRAVGFNRFSLFLIALSSASGLTVSLFVADAAFAHDFALKSEAKVGALFSLTFAALAAFLGRFRDRGCRDLPADDREET